MNRKIYIDVGGLNGDTLWGWTETPHHRLNFESYVWECDEGYVKQIKENIEGNKDNIKSKYKSITLVDKAATIADGPVRFYPGGRGGSLRRDKTTMIRKDRFYDVDGLDFVKWMKENFDEDDTIYCKINIEGAEYDILEKMITEDVLGWFDLLWVDFHARKLAELANTVVEANLIKKVEGALGKKFLTQQEAEKRGLHKSHRF